LIPDVENQKSDFRGANDSTSASFNKDGSADPLMYEIYKEFKIRQDSCNFYPNLVTNYGIPLWDKTIIAKTDSNQFAFTPVKHNFTDSIVSVIITCKSKTNINFNLVERSFIVNRLKVIQVGSIEFDQLFGQINYINFFSTILYGKQYSTFLNLNSKYKFDDNKAVPRGWILKLFPIWCYDECCYYCGGVQNNTSNCFSVNGTWMELKIFGYYAAYHEAGSSGIGSNFNSNNSTDPGGFRGDGGIYGSGSSNSNPKLNSFKELEQKLFLKAITDLNKLYGLDLKFDDFMKIIGLDCLTKIAKLPAAGWVDAVEDLDCIKSLLDYSIIYKLKLSQEELIWLNKHPDIKKQIIDIVLNYPGLDAKYVVRILKNNPNLNIQDFIDSYLLYQHLGDPNYIPTPVEEIDNGIIIENIAPISVLGGTPLAKTILRHGTEANDGWDAEDLQSGTDGNGKDIFSQTKLYLILIREKQTVILV
jgi:hypothetical protein